MSPILSILILYLSILFQIFHVLSARSVGSCANLLANTIWTGSQTLNTQGTYNLKWKMNPNKTFITIYMSITSQNHPTWIGFGVSEVGHMIGSDIITVFNYLDSNGNPIIYLTDNHAEWASMDPTRDVPWSLHLTEDDYQDATLLCSTRTSTTLEAIFTRYIDTIDQQDRIIKPGNNPIVYAWGFDLDHVRYHYENRGSTGVSFYDIISTADPSDTDGTTIIQFGNSFSTSANTRDQLICQSFDLGGDVRHVIAADAIIDGPAKGLAHHVLLHACGSTPGALYNLHLGRPSPCMDSSYTMSAEGDSPLGMGDCPSVLYGWARGSTRLNLPPNAGMSIGNGSTRYVILEIHFANPSHIVLNTNSLGMRLVTTHSLRQYNASALITGDYGQTLKNSTRQFSYIPALTSETHFETTCSSECTKNFTGNITVFSSLLHMHMLGKRIYLNKINSFGQVSTVDYRQFWNFGYQTMTTKNFTISPGDQLNLHCTMDSRLYATNVSFGPAATDEMCMGYLFYYPAENAKPFCGYKADKSTCGGAYDTFDELNPTTDETTDIPESMKFGIAIANNFPTGVPTISPTAYPSTSRPTSTPTSIRPSSAPSHSNTISPVGTSGSKGQTPDTMLTPEQGVLYIFVPLVAVIILAAIVVVYQARQGVYTDENEGGVEQIVSRTRSHVQMDM